MRMNGNHPAPGFQLLIVDDYEQLSQRAAFEITDAITRQPELLLCAASGATPARTYALVAQEAERAPQRFRQLRILCLDEWGGLRDDDPGSSTHQIRKQLAAPLALKDEQLFAFRGDALDPHAECSRVSEILEAQGPIDLAVLGLGQNGHLGLNEPAVSLQPHAHVAALHPASLAHSMLSHTQLTPSYGITLGMIDLMSSRRVLLLVSGAHKREVLARLVNGGIGAELPGSFLRMHANALCICDREAAADLIRS